jgi:hypothetical protein
MDDKHLKALRIFSPYYLQKAGSIESGNLRFIQYTSAEAAMGIISNNEVWLRNAQCMNDYSEVKHGLNCLITAFQSEEKGKAFQALLNSIFPGVINEFTNIFDSWLPSFRLSTYIACVSEHPPEEDRYGGLSMWRAYGGDRPVALVLNKEPFLADTDIFQPCRLFRPRRIQRRISYIQKFSVQGYLLDNIKLINPKNSAVKL